MLKAMPRRLRPIVVAVAALASLYLVFFAGLGRNPLLDPDEPIYGQFVKEMVATGNWLTPHYAGHLWFDKPPLFYWLSSICVKLFGFSDLAVRMPSAIFASLIVMMTYLLTCHDFGKRAGLLASVVAGTTLMMIIMSHAAATDTVMVFFMIASLYAYRRWLDSEGRSRLGWIAVCGASAGLGILTKGPVVPLLLTITILFHLAWTRQLKKLRLPDIALGTGIAIAIGLPWYIAMYVMHGKVFIDQFIMANNIGRFLTPLHKSQAGQWYSHFRNIPIMLLFFLPWSVFLPQAIVRKWRANSSAKLAFCWIAVVMVFFSISKTQNFTYTMPAFPACAMLVGALLAGIGSKEVSRRTLSVGIWTGFALMLLISAALFIVVGKKFPQATELVVPAAIVLISVFLIPLAWMLIHKTRLTPIPWMIASGMVAFSLVTMYILMPAVSDYKSSKRIAHHISDLQNVEVVAYNLWRPGLRYYLRQEPLDTKDVADIQRMANDSKPAVFVVRERDERQIEKYVNVEIYGCGDLDVYANNAYMQSQKNRHSPRTNMSEIFPGASQPKQTPDSAAP